jgi:23S rRNA pseudouridine955/2504/2580 synthase
MTDQNWETFVNSRVFLCERSRDGILALEKPNGVLAHPNLELQASESAIFTCKFSQKSEAYLPDDGGPIYLLHRIDAPVSGLILVSLNEKTSLAVKNAFKNRTVQKKYLALLKGHLPNGNGCWTSNISKIKSGNFVRAARFGNVTATTKYRLIGEFSWQNSALSIVELQPITGRTHQIRLHCSQNGVPIVGDKTYGDFNFNGRFRKLTGENRILLHSNEITVKYLLDGVVKSFHATSKYSFVQRCTDRFAK